MINKTRTLNSLSLIAAMTVPVPGAVLEFTNKPAWQNAAANFTTITFVGYPHGTEHR